MRKALKCTARIGREGDIELDSINSRNLTLEEDILQLRHRVQATESELDDLSHKYRQKCRDLDRMQSMLINSKKGSYVPHSLKSALMAKGNNKNVTSKLVKEIIVDQSKKLNEKKQQKDKVHPLNKYHTEFVNHHRLHSGASHESLTTFVGETLTENSSSISTSSNLPPPGAGIGTENSNLNKNMYNTYINDNKKLEELPKYRIGKKKQRALVKSHLRHGELFPPHLNINADI